MNLNVRFQAKNQLVSMPIEDSNVIKAMIYMLKASRLLGAGTQVLGDIPVLLLTDKAAYEALRKCTVTPEIAPEMLERGVQHEALLYVNKNSDSVQLVIFAREAATPGKFVARKNRPRTRLGSTVPMIEADLTGLLSRSMHQENHALQEKQRAEGLLPPRGPRQRQKPARPAAPETAAPVEEAIAASA